MRAQTFRLRASVFSFSIALALTGPCFGGLGRPGETDDLARLKQAMAPYAELPMARMAGYDTEITRCMESENGGQGYHYGNTGLLNDDGAVDLLRPELLMYEPQADGAMDLVGVEYAIPVNAWTAPEPPRLMERDFHVNEAFGVWVLHVWLRENPAGTFADWNMGVTCANAA